jgi:hypothetical protein
MPLLAAYCKFVSEKYPVSPSSSTFFNSFSFPVTSFMFSSSYSSILEKLPLSGPEPVTSADTII